MNDARSLPTLLVVAAIFSVGAARCSSSSSSREAADAGPMGPSSPYDAGMPVVGQIDGGVATKLPTLPTLTNVLAAQNDDSVSVTFDPFDGALDYRVYPLPKDGDITISADGSIVVSNAIYRCAGDRESPAPVVDNGASIASDAITTMVDQQMVGGYLRTMANATLGYVYTQPGPGLVPVYALGESDPNADTTCYFARWQASRTKLYTTSDSARAQALSALDRDDGIVFYVPATADGTTTQIYMDEDGVGTASRMRYYFPDGPEADAHATKQPAFLALASAAPGTTPLMRVFYQNECGWSHDELVAGQERFNRAYKQGDTQPWWSLLWTGITGPTTLVVEALDTGCPYQGHLSPTSLPNVTASFGTEPLFHQPFVTVDDIRAASATTEVFINGQQGPAWQWSGSGDADGGVAESAPTAAQLMANTGAGLPLPKAIARSFVAVAPNAHPAMDFFAAFAPGSTPETFTTVPCGVPGGNCYATWRQQSPTFDQMFISTEFATTDEVNGLFAYGQSMGEWWVTYGDVGADTNGKYRLTANQKATMSSSSFLHVTMEVDGYSTGRRYPQILISDQDAPVQYGLVNGHTIVVETIGEITPTAVWPIDYQVEICNLRTWDVNNQCPKYNFHDNMDSSGNTVNLAPNDEVGEHASVDHRILFDVFASTQRVYLFLDGQPYACANLPSVGPPASGPVTVTWGDVLYHSAVDLTYTYHAAHMQIDTRRHFDNLGFSSGVAAPTWDESRLPCAAPISL